MGSVGLFPVTFLIVAIGMSLGGATGYAINPARDLPPVSLILFYRSGVKGVVDGDIAGFRFWVLSWGPVWLPGVIK